jgi:hypothetical protein
MKPKNQICTLNLTADCEPQVRIPVCPTRERLAASFTLLERFQLVRSHSRDPFFEKCTEERIIWRELLELELQALDEHFARRSGEAAARPN